MSVFPVATSQAQTDMVVLTGKFTSGNQVLWSETVLRPGDYTITIGSTSMPTFALVRDSKGRHVARFVSGIDGGPTVERSFINGHSSLHRILPSV